MPTLRNTLQDIDRCPQCNVAKPLMVLKASVAGAAATERLSYNHFVYQCASCHDVCLVSAYMVDTHRDNIVQSLHNFTVHPDRILPVAEGVDEAIPTRARRYLEQAIDALQSPDGAIMLAASSVDAMLKEIGLENGSLFSRINEAVRGGVLTKSMGEWAHSVRLEANRPRHADLDDPHATYEEANQSIDFVEALGEFLFVLPARIAKGKADAETVNNA